MFLQPLLSLMASVLLTFFIYKIKRNRGSTYYLAFRVIDLGVSISFWMIVGAFFNEVEGAKYTVILLATFIGLFTLLPLFTRYEITEQTLIIKRNIFSKIRDINISSILSIRYEMELVSGAQVFVLKMKDEKEIQIDRDIENSQKFIEELKKRNESIDTLKVTHKKIYFILTSIVAFIFFASGFYRLFEPLTSLF